MNESQGSIRSDRGISAPGRSLDGEERSRYQSADDSIWLENWLRNELRWAKGSVQQLERQLRWRTIILGSALALSVVVAVAATGSTMILLRMPEPLVGASEGTRTSKASAASRSAVEKFSQPSVRPLQIRRGEAPPPHQPEPPARSPKMPRQSEQTLASRPSQEPAAVPVPRVNDSGESEERAKGAGGQRAAEAGGRLGGTGAKFPKRSFETAARGGVASTGSQIVKTGMPKRAERIERRATTGHRAGTEIDSPQAARVVRERIEDLGSPQSTVAAVASRANTAPPEEATAAPLEPPQALDALIAEWQSRSWPQAAALPAAHPQAPLRGLPSGAQESRVAPLQPGRLPLQAAPDPATPGRAPRLELASGASSLEDRPALLADHIRVFIYYVADHQGDAALARQLADHLRRRGFTVSDIRPVDISIDNPSVRYFFARDRAASRRLVDELRRFFKETQSRAPDQASDFTHFMSKPRPGNVEVWLPVK